MSILIRGMEMPTGCDTCPFEHFGDCYGGKAKRIMDIDEEVALGVRHKRCPLIPVPPHGRLIDADALCMKLKMMYAQAFGDGNSAYHSAYRSLEKVVEHEPTVIDADKEGGE